MVDSDSQAMRRMCTGEHDGSTAGNSSSFYYFNGPLFDGPFAAISGLLGGTDPTMNASVFNPVTASVLTHQVWMGTPGVITHLHYDVSSNFFIQLRGRKRFVLASASAHRAALLCGNHW